MVRVPFSGQRCFVSVKQRQLLEVSAVGRRGERSVGKLVGVSYEDRTQGIAGVVNVECATITALFKQPVEVLDQPAIVEAVSSSPHCARVVGVAIAVRSWLAQTNRDADTQELSSLKYHLIKTEIIKRSGAGVGASRGDEDVHTPNNKTTSARKQLISVASLLYVGYTTHPPTRSPHRP